MNDIFISNLVTIGVVCIGFIGNALYLRGNFGARIKNNEDDITTLQKTVRYADTCDSAVAGLDTRLSLLERLRNGRK